MKRIAIGGCVILALFLAAGLFYPFLSGHHSTPRVISELAQIKVALKSYSLEYGTYPAIDKVGPSLFGENERKIIFFETREDQVNARKDILDPWKTPYRFAITSDGFFVIWSAGKDKKFDCRDHPSDDDWKEQIKISNKGVHATAYTLRVPAAHDA